jgi:hypothetical protein
LRGYFKDFNASDEDIVVDLQKNPGLYSALSLKELYDEVVIKEVNGMIILNPNAKEIIHSYRRDETFYEYNLLDGSLTIGLTLLPFFPKLKLLIHAQTQTH